MTGTVLAAIDLAHPENHHKILHEAQVMAAQRGASMSVVTVIPDFGMSIVGTYFEEGAEQRALKDAAKTLHEAVTKVLGADADKQIKHVVCHGVAYEQILATAKKFDAVLIVMAAHRPEFRDYLLGPNAARVVRHSTCSVLVLRD
ncbi:nucleotide-binding universal stress UspA family protein [Yoonia maricola]|uniref:Nucleotide-binding universal stress UspA family protein n=1 Tax=Yoonia maricola TaxID=420999 RepID=A0A2M8W5M1_9RHOB|nr:universal stress protein [Yoonia maricola]PJI86223.1 nucleotide-binding universal stress UspA family protein [Yoonia maricola]